MFSYSDFELSKDLQNFEYDHYLVKTGKAGKLCSAIGIKALMVGTMCWQAVYNLYKWTLVEHSRALTSWALLLTFFHVALSLKCSIDTEISKKRRYLIANHIVAEVTLPINLVVTIVYWLLLWEECLIKYGNDPTLLFHTIVIHSLPMALTVLNFCVTDIVFKKAHALSFFVIGLVYGYHNYSQTMSMGEPVYWFLPWDGSGSSTLTIGGLSLGCAIFFVSVAGLTRKVRTFRPKVPDRSNDHETDNAKKV